MIFHHQTVSLQAAPSLGDCKGRGYRGDRRTGQTERKTSEFIAIWFWYSYQESSGKGLNFIENDVFLLFKYDGNYNWEDFHTIRKAQM